MKASHSFPPARLILVLLIFLMALPACSSLGGADLSFPTGTFVPPVQRTAGITVVFGEDGTYTMSGPKLLPIQGTYSVDKDRITFTEAEGGSCAGIQGTYTWALDDNGLTFTPVEDSCSIRRIDWQAGAWSRQE